MSEKDYGATLNLPKTSFQMKANLPNKEPKIIQKWEENKIYEKGLTKGTKSFILHDGPPYANGDIHIGHALNKILKDIILKYKRLRGYNAPYIPGWDTHGLPIELKVTEKLGEKAKAEGIALFTYPTTGYFDAFFSALLNETVGADAYTKLMEYDTKTWQSAETKKAFEIVGKLAQYTEANTVANANKDNFTKNQQLILDNKPLFCPNGTWLPDEMSEAPRAEGFKWGFMALPKVSAEGDSYSSTFSEQVYIPSKAKNADLAKKFITFMYSDEAAKLFAEESGCVLPTTTASSYLPEKVKDKDGNEIDNQKTLFYQIYDNGAKSCTVGFKSVDAIEGVDLTSAEGILYGTVNSVVTGDKTVDEWYNAVIDAVKKYDK